MDSDHILELIHLLGRVANIVDTIKTEWSQTNHWTVDDQLLRTDITDALIKLYEVRDA